MLWWSVLADLPTGVERVHAPVILAQDALDVIAAGQTPRYLAANRGSQFVPLLGAGHAPQSDRPDAIVRLVHQATAEAAAVEPVVHPHDEPEAGVHPLHPARGHDERATS
jgi:pimeloyl-ACP methyl ester carboxylesterase